MKPLAQSFKDLLLAMSKEFDEKDGCVTCEVAVHKDKIEEFKAFVETIPLLQGKWVVYGECPACERYHGQGFWHCQIDRKVPLVSRSKLECCC